MRILCLFVRHGVEKYPDALTILDRWYEKHGLIGSRTLWIIDNALDTSRCPEVLAPDVLLRAGDNRAWEFSAWDQALNQLAAAKSKFDLIHFVTSAFNTLYTQYLDHFHNEMLEYVQTRNVCLGHIDGFKQPMRLEDALSSAWVRTCFFFLTQARAEQMVPLASYSDPATFFPHAGSQDFLPDAPLGREYQAHISAWLQGREIGWHRWHSPVSAGDRENIRFQRKTLAILNEQKFAINLRKTGIKPADFCWLFSQRATPISALPDPPLENEQLAIRRKILGFQE